MMGWRCGYIAYLTEGSGSGDLAAQLNKVQDTIPICAPQASSEAPEAMCNCLDPMGCGGHFERLGVCDMPSVAPCKHTRVAKLLPDQQSIREHFPTR